MWVQEADSVNREKLSMTFFCFENLSFSFFNYILKYSEVRFTQPSVALTVLERKDHVLCSLPSRETPFESGSVSLFPPCGYGAYHQERASRTGKTLTPRVVCRLDHT